MTNKLNIDGTQWDQFSIAQLTLTAGAESADYGLNFDTNLALDGTTTLVRIRDAAGAGLQLGAAASGSGSCAIEINDTTNVVTIRGSSGVTMSMGSHSYAINSNGALAIDSSAGTSGQVLTSAGSSGVPTWQTPTGTPGGSNTQLQYNNSGAFGGISSATYNSGTSTLSITTSVLATTTVNTRLNMNGVLYDGSASAGTSGQYLKSNGSGSPPTWANGTSAAGGSDTQVQYNSSGSLAGNSKLTYIDGMPGLYLGAAGGAFTLWGNSGDATHDGVDVNLFGGSIAGATANAGGNVTLVAGSATGTGGTGADVIIRGGNGAVADGSIYLDVPVGGSTPGKLIIRQFSGGTEMARVNSTGAWSYGSSGTNFGTSGYILKSQGSATNPTWVDPATIVGAPAGSNMEIQYNNAGAMGANTGYKIDTANNHLVIGTDSSTTFRIVRETVSSGTAGILTIRGAAHSGTGAGGLVTLAGGTPTDGAGGAVSISGANGVGTDKAGGAVTLAGGTSTGTGTGGSLIITSGAGSGTAGCSSGACTIGSAGATNGTSGNTFLQSGGGSTIGSVNLRTGGVAGTVRLSISGTGALTSSLSTMGWTTSGAATHTYGGNSTIGVTGTFGVTSSGAMSLTATSSTLNLTSSALNINAAAATHTYTSNSSIGVTGTFGITSSGNLTLNTSGTLTSNVGKFFLFDAGGTHDWLKFDPTVGTASTTNPNVELHYRQLLHKFGTDTVGAYDVDETQSQPNLTINYFPPQPTGGPTTGTYQSVGLNVNSTDQATMASGSDKSNLQFYMHSGRQYSSPTAFSLGAGFKLYYTDASGTPALSPEPIILNIHGGAATLNIHDDHLHAVNMPIVFPDYTVTALNALTMPTYARAFANDALAPTFGATVVGGGSAKTPVWYDGANWIVG